MLNKIARGAFLLLLAGMIVAYAVTATSSKPPQPKADQTIEMWYC